MKKLITSLFSLSFFILLSSSLMAQSPCDTCTAPWGPVQHLTLTGQTIPEKPGSCTYTFTYQYRERDCGGNIEIDIVDIFARSENATGVCPLTNFGDCYYSRKAAIRSLVDFLGYPVTLSQEAACYAIFVVEPPQDFIDCFLSPGEVVDEWYAYVECDTTSCCRTTYTPNGDGTVNYQYDTSIVCTPGATPNLPTHVTWYCKGVPYTFPVNQGQPVNCEATCYTGGGTLFRKISVLDNDTEQEKSYFTLFPNPTKGNVTLQYKAEEKANLTVRVFNVQGQVVYSKQINSNSQVSQIRIETAQWSTGLYTIHLEENGTLLESQKIQVLK